MRAGWLLRLALRAVPARWRASVGQDLLEERAGSAATAEVWRAWHAARIGVAFRWVGLRNQLADWRSPMRGVGSDIHFAARSIGCRPLSSAAIVLTLALGIGATTATYAIFNYVLFRPVPGVADLSRVVTVQFEKADNRRAISSGSRRALAEMRRSPSVDLLGDGSETSVPAVFRAGAEPVLTKIELVSDQYLEVLGVRARIGRLFTEEEAASHSQLAVVSEALWRGTYAGRNDVLGQTVTLSGRPFTVVGVMADYRGWGTTRVGTVDVWVPVGASASATLRSDDGEYLGRVVARLRVGATASQAQDQLRSAYRGVVPTATFVPSTYSGLYLFSAQSVFNRIYQLYPFALGGTAILLLLACANTANLLMAQLSARARDLALRGALGAGRARLIRGLLAEAGLLSGLAAMAGLALALALTKTLGTSRLFRVDATLVDLSLDWRVVVFAAGVAAATVVVFGLLPVISATRTDLRSLTQQGGRATTRTRRVRSALVAAQLALSLALMATAGVLTRSVVYRTNLDLGMAPDGVVEFTVNANHIGYKGERYAALVKSALARIPALPGIEAAAVASPPAFFASTFSQRVVADDAPGSPAATPLHSAVSGEYFRALGIPLRSGRTFTDVEYARAGGGPNTAAVINESLARQLFGAGPAIGRSVGVAHARDGSGFRHVHVVGVVGDTRAGSNLLAEQTPMLYEPGNAVLVSDTFYVRSRRASSEVFEDLRRVMRDVEPGLPLTNVRTLRDEVAELFPEDLALARLMRLVAALAALLGVAGVHAVMTFALAERTREFGIRVALGASSADVTRLVLKGAGFMVGAGLVVGLALLMSTSKLLVSRLTGVSERDPLTLVSACIVLCVVALVAAWIPTRRAARVSPTVALRAD